MATGIVDTLTLGQFADGMRRYCDHAQFSDAAITALYEYLNNLSEDLGEPIEFDPVGIRCEFREYTTTAELADEIGCFIPDDAQLRRYVEARATIVAWDIDDDGNGMIVLHGW